MSALDFVGLLLLCSVIAWVYLHVIADIICPSDRVRDLRAWRERRSRRPRVKALCVYDQDSDGD